MILACHSTNPQKTIIYIFLGNSLKITKQLNIMKGVRGLLASDKDVFTPIRKWNREKRN